MTVVEQYRSREDSPQSEGSEYDLPHGMVSDIGGSVLSERVKDELETKFLWKYGKYQKDRMIPASIFHDDFGLNAWKSITRLPDYYQTKDEIDLLKENSKELVDSLAGIWILIDLGCGDVRKVLPLLDAFERLQIPVQYFALDLSLPVLEEGMNKLRSRYRFVQCHGLWGTFDDGLEWSKKITSPVCWMSLGSMLGNDYFDRAIMRLKNWAAAMRPADRMLLGLDACQDRDVIWKSYHDDHGLFHDFIINGFQKSNELLQHDWFREEDWKLSGDYQPFPLMHHFTMTAQSGVRCEPLGIEFEKGKKIVCYEGFKYEPFMVKKQIVAAGLKASNVWKSPSGRIYQYLVQTTGNSRTKI